MQTKDTALSHFHSFSLSSNYINVCCCFLCRERTRVDRERERERE